VSDIQETEGFAKGEETVWTEEGAPFGVDTPLEDILGGKDNNTLWLSEENAFMIGDQQIEAGTCPAEEDQSCETEGVRPEERPRGDEEVTGILRSERDSPSPHSDERTPNLREDSEHNAGTPEKEDGENQRSNGEPRSDDGRTGHRLRQISESPEKNRMGVFQVVHERTFG
jgi:hypothetical protein